MPELEYFIVSESISVDQRTNRVSLFNVVEEVRSKVFPVLLPQVVAASAWNRVPSDEDIDYQAILRLYAPGEDTAKEYTVNFKVEKDRHRNFHYIANLSLKQPGDLKFEILLNGKHVATHTVTVQREE